jgi:quinol monooxygenase YgiN
MRPENRKELYQTILPLLSSLRKEKGCMNYRLFVDATDDNSLELIGEWETQRDWANHLHSRDFAVLLGAITVLSSPAGIDFKLLSSIPDANYPSEFRVFSVVPKPSAEPSPTRFIKAPAVLIDKSEGVCFDGDGSLKSTINIVDYGKK